MTKVTIELDPLHGDVILVSSFQDKEYCKMIPGARWDKDDRVWRAPLSWSTCKVTRGVFGNRLEIGPNLHTWAWDHYTKRIKPALDLRESMDEDAVGAWEPRLFPFQRAGVAFLEVAKQAILADEMGTGKTIQTICALRWAEERGDVVFPLLIICPNTMKQVWRREVLKWWPGMNSDDVQVVRGGAVERRNTITSGAKVVIMNWESVRLHSRLAPYGSIKLTDKDKEAKELNEVAWRSVIADEAHKLKNPQSQQSRAVKAVAWQDSVHYRFALTGTPIANHAGDAWSLLNFMNPKEFPSKTRYVDRYCLLSWNAFGGMDVVGLRPDTMDEFHAVVDPSMRRMPKELVLKSLPPKFNETRVVEMGPKQAKAYQQMLDNMVAALDAGEVVITTNALAQMTRLIQFSSAYAEVDETGEVRLTAPSNKVDALIELVEEMGDEPLVVFAQSRQLIMLAAAELEKAGVRFRLLVGGQTDVERQQGIDDFQDGKAQVILCTVAAGGVGVTLTRARVIVFLQRSWSMVDNVQAEARVHRIGSEAHDNVLIIDLVSENTIDERLLEVLTTKKERLEEVVKDKELLRRLLVGDEVKKLKKGRKTK